jgi:hypothetical protein
VPLSGRQAPTTPAALATAGPAALVAAPFAALPLPPISLLAETAAELATAAQDAGDTANMHALNKATGQLHAGTVPVVTAGGFLVESRTRGGVVHRVSNVHGCSCEAGRAGRPCWHISLIEIIEVAQQRALPVVPVAVRIAQRRQALVEMDELFA